MEPSTEPTQASSADPSAEPRKLVEQVDEFYVGYLPMPTQHRQLITKIVIAMTMWCVAIAFILAMTMRDPGSATWNTNTIKEWSGVLWETPYPHLVFDSPQLNQGRQSILVVAMGKHGAHQQLKDYFGHRVTLSGYELIRDGRHLIELDAGEDAIKLISDATTPPTRLLHAIPLTPSTDIDSETKISESRTGEIVDGKCYLGAMKPGDGMGHRACATLCIQGGLPPMFVAQTDSGDQIYYLLIVDGSTTLSQSVLGKIARPVEIVGTPGQLHGLPIFQTTESQIQLLQPLVQSTTP